MPAIKTPVRWAATRTVWAALFLTLTAASPAVDAQTEDAGSRQTAAAGGVPVLSGEDRRAALAEVLGLTRMPEHAKPASRVTEAVDTGVYKRERVELEVEPGAWAPAYVFVPSHGRPVATVIALHGHGPGKSLTIGLTRNAWEREQVHLYQRGFGREAAIKGYAVIVPDQRGFGERMHPADRAAGLLKSCDRFQAEALEQSQTLIGRRVYDVQQWIAYAQSRPEMDASRLAVLGHSAGGTAALFTAALDDRVQVAVVSGYFGTWQESVLGVPHCVCNEVPGIERVADLADVACLVAPRPLLLSLGADDEWVPAPPARRAFTLVKSCYARHGGGPAELRFGDGGHRVYGMHIWPFLERHLPPEAPVTVSRAAVDG